MCALIMPPVAGLVMPQPPPVIWVENIGAVASVLDGQWLATYYYRTEISLEDGRESKVVELIKLMPVAAVPQAMLVGAAVVGKERRNWPPRRGLGPHIVR